MFSVLLSFTLATVVLCGTVWYINMSADDPSDRSLYTVIWLVQGLPRLFDSWLMEFGKLAKLINAEQMSFDIYVEAKSKYEFASLVELLKSVDGLFSVIRTTALEEQGRKAGPNNLRTCVFEVDLQHTVADAVVCTAAARRKHLR